MYKRQDPQKYADRVLHRDFVEPFAGHDAVTLVLLNQIDYKQDDDVNWGFDKLKDSSREQVFTYTLRVLSLIHI